MELQKKLKQNNNNIFKYFWGNKLSNKLVVSLLGGHIKR